MFGEEKLRISVESESTPFDGEQETLLSSKCPRCGEDLGVEYYYKQHLECCELYRCRLCRATERDFQQLRLHVYRQHHFLIHSCEYCQHISFDETDKETHKLRNCHLKGAFQCETCSLQFEKVHHIQQHSKLHLSAYPYRCLYCNFKEQHVNKWRDHQRSHSRLISAYRCPYCALGCISIVTASRHLKASHIREYV